MFTTYNVSLDILWKVYVGYQLIWSKFSRKTFVMSFVQLYGNLKQWKEIIILKIAVNFLD